jgi:hypothetical protein
MLSSSNATRKDGVPAASEALLDLLARAVAIHRYFRPTADMAATERSVQALKDYLLHGIQSLAFIAYANDVAAMLVRYGTWRPLLTKCVALRRAFRIHRKTVEAELPSFLLGRTTPFSNDRIPGESAAAAIWSQALRLATAIREAMRARTAFLVAASQDPHLASFRSLESLLADLARRLLVAFNGAVETDYEHLAAELRWERGRLGNASPTEPQSRGLAKAKGPTAEARVLATLAMHPEWSDQAIADAAKVHRRTLYKFESFRFARKAARAGGTGVLREEEEEE